MAENNNSASASIAASAAEVGMDALKVGTVRSTIVSYSKQLEQDIDSIDKAFDLLEDYWQSSTATYYKKTVKAKINEIRKEQATLTGNLTKFFGSVMQKYEAAETNLNKNADLFK